MCCYESSHKLKPAHRLCFKRRDSPFSHNKPALHRFVFKLSSQVGACAIDVLTSITEHVQRGFRITSSQFRSTLGTFTFLSSSASLHHSRHSGRSASFSSSSHPYFIRSRFCGMILLLTVNGRRSPRGSQTENASLKTFLFVVPGSPLSSVKLRVSS